MLRRKNRWDSDSDSDSERKKRKTSARERETQKSAEETYKALPLVHNFYWFGCRSVDNYARIGKIDEGTYGVVSKARDKKTGDIVALKQVKMSAELCHEGFPVTALRETNVLLALSRHPNIIQVKEMVVGSTPDKIYMVMEYADNDLKTLMESKMQAPFLQSEVKTLMKQLLSAVAFMHDHWFLHRDLKTSNLLYDKHGTLKVCDFGLARKYESPIRQYTQLVVTLWYRAPELLLTHDTTTTIQYATAVDMWSVGCIFAEMVLRKPLFPGRGELGQIDRILSCLGMPPSKLIEATGLDALRMKKYSARSRLHEKFPSVSYGNAGTLSNAGIDLLSKLLALDPLTRISAKDALNHPYFHEAPAPKPAALMPTFPA